jgi:acetolactate synthase regulatory subunit
MQIKLSIKSDKSAGVLARIIVALRRINLHLAQQKMIEAADHLQIDLIVEEPEISEIERVQGC